MRTGTPTSRRRPQCTAMTVAQAMLLVFLVVVWAISLSPIIRHHQIADAEQSSRSNALDRSRGGGGDQSPGRSAGRSSVVPSYQSLPGVHIDPQVSSYVPGRHLDDTELKLNGHLLVIAVDTRHSCPDLCAFAHVILPPWVRYRYIDFVDEKDLAETLKDYDGHVLIVARTNTINLANWAVVRRHRGGLDGDKKKVVSTGLWHNADERVFGGEINNVYHKFDYVIRHYWRVNEEGKLYNNTLHALGNYTCGTKKQTLPLTGNEYGPKWGVHWAFLNAHGGDIQLSRHATSTWPIALRPTNCSFIGRKDVKRSKHERGTMKDAIETYASELGCNITITHGFTAGNTKWNYYNYDLAGTKIGLSPRGSAVETHRLTELLRVGTVPAIVDEEYLHAPFIDVPGIIGASWKETALKMVEVIKDERGGGKRLEDLSRRSAKFYRDLEACMTEDMTFILKGAFGLNDGQLLE